jgi:hypothetical protein
MKHLPGFTVEASAYESAGRYLMGENPSQSTTNRAVPQIAINFPISDSLANSLVIGGGIGGIIGTVVPGVGTSVGAAVGAFLGGLWCSIFDCAPD